MKLSEIVKAVNSAEGVVPERISEKRLGRIVVTALRAIGAEIDGAADGGRVNIPGLGVFRTKAAKDPKDGKSRRATFRRTQPKARRKGKA